jgi:hypothetical protein
MTIAKSTTPMMVSGRVKPQIALRVGCGLTGARRTRAAVRELVTVSGGETETEVEGYMRRIEWLLGVAGGIVYGKKVL